MIIISWVRKNKCEGSTRANVCFFLFSRCLNADFFSVFFFSVLYRWCEQLAIKVVVQCKYFKVDKLSSLYNVNFS